MNSPEYESTDSLHLHFSYVTNQILTKRETMNPPCKSVRFSPTSKMIIFNYPTWYSNEEMDFFWDEYARDVLKCSKMFQYKMKFGIPVVEEDIMKSHQKTHWSYETVAYSPNTIGANSSEGLSWLWWCDACTYIVWKLGIVQRELS
jgi:hypothetical protein